MSVKALSRRFVEYPDPYISGKERRRCSASRSTGARNIMASYRKGLVLLSLKKLFDPMVCMNMSYVRTSCVGSVYIVRRPYLDATRLNHVVLFRHESDDCGPRPRGGRRFPTIIHRRGCFVLLVAARSFISSASPTRIASRTRSPKARRVAKSMPEGSSIPGPSSTAGLLPSTLSRPFRSRKNRPCDACVSVFSHSISISGLRCEL